MFSALSDGETVGLAGIELRDILLGYVGAASAIASLLAVAIGAGVV